jgi:hypothetical protein
MARQTPLASQGQVTLGQHITYSTPMALRTLTPTELRSLHFCDACVTSISWENEDLDLRIVATLGDGRTATFIFRWTEKLRIDLTYPERTNLAPKTWEVIFDDSQAGVISVLFDFASQGSLRLQCETVDVDGI